MAGVTGADVKAAYAVSNTWGTPASVTAQMLIRTTEGFDAMPVLVDDDAFNQTFLGEGESGDFRSPTPTIEMQARYEGAVPKWIAYAMGSAAAPSVVSSVAANSLVAYSHALTLANRIGSFLTVAVDESQYVLEIPTLKVHGFSLRVGENGKMMVSYPTVAAKVNYASATNINSTVAGAAAASMAQRIYRSQGVFRLNLQSAAALAAADNQANAGDITVAYTAPLTSDEATFGQNYTIEPELSDFPEFSVDVTFLRMNTVSANSLAIAAQTGVVFKGDLTFTGNHINSTTQRSVKFEWPALQLVDFKSPFTGHKVAQPVGTFRAKQATTSPTGMAFVAPLKVTVVNANSANLMA